MYKVASDSYLHTQQWVDATRYGHLGNTVTPSLPALAVLNMQLVFFTSLLAKLPIPIRMFEKMTKEEKQTGQQEVDALTSLTRMACAKVSSLWPQFNEKWVCVSGSVCL